MIINIHGATCRVLAMPGKYVDIEFEDEVMVTSDVIEQLINNMYSGSYYALHIVTKSPDFLDTLRTRFGFSNGIYWSNRIHPPLDIVFQQLFTSETKMEAENGDIIYYRGSYDNSSYTAPVGYADGRNILVQDPYSRYRILNPAWGVVKYFNEEVDTVFSNSILDYFVKNQLSLMSADKLVSGQDSFHLIVNPYNAGITITGPSTLSLSTDLLVCYNGVVNIPFNEKCCIINDTWKLTSSLLTKSTMFIFSHQRRTYICVSDIQHVTEIATLPPKSFEVVTPLGVHSDGSSITVLNYFLQRGESM